MTDWTNFAVGQFIGGRAFFFGMALCLLGCFLNSFFSKTRIYSLARVTLLAGIVFVVLSAAPFSFWVYGVFFALLALAAFRPIKGLRWGKQAAYLLLLLLLTQSPRTMRW
jgi:hypothetical protein